MPNPFSAAARFVVSGRRRIARLSPRRRVIEALESRTYFAVALDANGFTVVTPAADSRVIYVSSSQGNDNNDGRAPERPVKTLNDALSHVRNNSADQVLLKRGDVWTNQTFGGWWKSGRSADEPIVIGAYGTGERPRLDTGSSVALDANSGTVKHLSIIGLHLSAHTRLPGSRFVSTAGSPGIRVVAKADDLLIEDCFIQGYRDNVMFQDFEGPITNVRVRRNVIVDAYGSNGSHAQGLYAEGVDGLLLEENVFDHNGWLEGKATPTGFNHNVYMRAHNDGVVVRGNVFANASSHGLQARAGGVIENNLFLDNPIGMSFGLVNGSPATPGGVSGRVDGNVFIGGDDQKIGANFRGWAIEVGNTKPGAASTISNNLFTGSGDGQMPAIILGVGDNLENKSQTAGLNDLTIRGNVVYNWAQGIRVASSLRPGQSGPDGLNDLVVRDNDFQAITGRTILHDMPFTASTETWSGNRYNGGSDGRPEILMTFNLLSWDRWRSDREPTARSAQVQYPAADRTAATYNASLGGEGSTAAFLAEARQQSSQSWRGQFTAGAVVAYMREGFTEGGSLTSPPAAPPAPPPAVVVPAPAPEPPQPGEPTAPAAPSPVQPDPPPPPSAPVATTDLPGQVQVIAGEAALTFTVTYADADAAIDVATLDAGDVRVVGRRGFDQPATLVSVQPAGDGVSGTSVVATYAVATPDGGPWARNDRGTYTVVANPEEVRDAAGFAVEPAELAEFKLTVAKAPRVRAEAVDKPPAVRKLKFDGRGAASVTAWFSEDVSASIDAGDLFLFAEDGVTRAVDPSLVSVTYDAEKNCATWRFPGIAGGILAKGKYRVTLPGWGIADSIGQGLDGNKDGIPGDDFAPARWFRA